MFFESSTFHAVAQRGWQIEITEAAKRGRREDGMDGARDSSYQKRSCMVTAPTSDKDIFTLSAPDPALWKLYLIRALFTGPGVIFVLPYLSFRYHTLRYTFDEEGIHMRVGILYRREVNLTYARIQDIHLRSGVIQRWLGLADIQIQTASGSADAELVIEGFKEYDKIRDFLYTRMRGYHAPAAARADEPAADAGDPNAEMISLLQTIRDELRQTREALGKSQPAE